MLCITDLKQVSVLISNGGYGTVQQALRAGLPMILSGVGQDKLQTGTLVERSGVGIYHAVPQVTAAMLTGAVEKILTNATYRYVFPSIANYFDWADTFKSEINRYGQAV